MNAAKVRHIMYKRSYRNWDEPNKIARDQMKYRKWEEPNDLAWVQMKYGVWELQYNWGETKKGESINSILSLYCVVEE